MRFFGSTLTTPNFTSRLSGTIRSRLEEQFMAGLRCYKHLEILGLQKILEWRRKRLSVQAIFSSILGEMSLPPSQLIQVSALVVSTQGASYFQPIRRREACMVLGNPWVFIAGVILGGTALIGVCVAAAGLLSCFCWLVEKACTLVENLYCRWRSRVS